MLQQKKKDSSLLVISHFFLPLAIADQNLLGKLSNEVKLHFYIYIYPSVWSNSLNEANLSSLEADLVE